MNALGFLSSATKARPSSTRCFGFVTRDTLYLIEVGEGPGSGSPRDEPPSSMLSAVELASLVAAVRSIGQRH